MNEVQWKMDSEIGPLYLVASEKGLRGVFWKKQAGATALKSLGNGGSETRTLARAVKQLEEYLEGKRSRFELPLDVEGSSFQKQVWKALAGIPYGKTRSYREIARSLKNENAVRAVGTANGKNPLCIIVPCHRVIASDGTLGGYSGGLTVKTKLLELERRTGKLRK